MVLSLSCGAEQYVCEQEDELNRATQRIQAQSQSLNQEIRELEYSTRLVNQVRERENTAFFCGAGFHHFFLLPFVKTAGRSTVAPQSGTQHLPEGDDSPLWVLWVHFWR